MSLQKLYIRHSCRVVIYSWCLIPPNSERGYNNVCIVHGFRHQRSSLAHHHERHSCWRRHHSTGNDIVQVSHSFGEGHLLSLTTSNQHQWCPPSSGQQNFRVQLLVYAAYTHSELLLVGAVRTLIGHNTIAWTFSYISAHTTENVQGHQLYTLILNFW